MSKEIDERIVQMEFDNKQFEQNIHTSINSLNELEKSLKLKDATKGLSGVDNAAKKVDMTTLGGAVEKVQARFSAMEVIAVTALANITNSAVNAGKRIVSALTIDPVKTGFSEYETQINAIQTILANTESKGTTLKDVNNALDELNAYADKTIYNFTEMTRNIGTFTAAGTDLDTSVKAIKGIANLAAVSGSTSQQASTAMYQLSQALSSGVVKLMDWNSVVNAGMGGQVFQDALKETARVHGVQIDKMIDAEGSFRESLKNGWLTSEILTETLEKFTLASEEMTEAEKKKNKEMLKSKGYTDEQIEAIFKLGNTATNAATKVKTFSQLMDTLKEAAQSGWTQTWEIIVGDFEEAKELLTKVSDTIGGMLNKSAQARNEMLKGWKDLGGRKALIDAIKNAFEGIVNIIKPIKDAFRDIFPKKTGEQLFALTERLKNFTAKFKDLFKEGSKTSKNLNRTFKGLFALFDIGIRAVKAVVNGFMKLVGIVAPAGDGILGLTAILGDAIVKFREFIKSSNVFNKVIGGIVTVIGAVIEGFKKFVSSIADALTGFTRIDLSGVDSFTEKLKLCFEPFTALGEGLMKVFKAFGKIVKKIAPLFLAIVNAIGKLIGGVADKVSTAIENADFEGLVEIIEGLLTGGLVLSIKMFIDRLSKIVKESGEFLESFREIFEEVGDTLRAFQLKLKAEALLTIAAAIGVLAAALVVISMIDSDKLAASLGVISALFIEMFASMGVLSATMGSAGGIADGIKKLLLLESIGRLMLKIAVSVLILSAAMAIIGNMDPKSITKGLTAITTLIAMLTITSVILSKVGGKVTKGLTKLIALAIAVRILTGAVKKLGELDMKSIGRGLLGVGALMAELVLFMKMSSSSKMGSFKALGLILLAAAIKILASAVEDFSELDVASMLKGLAAVAVVLAELAVFVKLTKNAKHVMTTSTGLVILGAAMLIFAKAVSDLGKLSWSEIGKGLLTIAGALIVVTAAVNLMPKSMVSKGTGMVLLSSALLILGNTLSDMGGLSWEEMAKALVTLAGSLAIITVAMNFMKKAVVGAMAMQIIAPAVGIFALALKGLATLSWGEMVRALITLAGTFAIVGAAAIILQPVTPIVLALSAAIVLLGIGCLATGVGLLSFAAGLTALAAAGTVGVAAFTAMLTAIIELIPRLMFKIVEGLIVGLCETIANSVKAICEAITTVLLAVINALTACIPPLLECLGTLITEFLNFITKKLPEIIAAGVNFILAFLKGISDNIEDIVEVVADLFVKFTDAVGEQIPRIIQAGWDFIFKLIDGIGASIEANLPRLELMIGDLVRTIIRTLGQCVGNVFVVGKEIIAGLCEGLWAAASTLAETLWDIVTDAWDGVLEFFGIESPSKTAAEAGMYIDEGLAKGIDDNGYKVTDAAKKVCEATENTMNEELEINSPSKMATKLGRFIDLGLAKGITKNTDEVTDSTKDLCEDTTNTLTKGLKFVADLIAGGINLSPTIRPVIDLTDVENGEKQLSNMFNKTKTITVDTANIRAAAISDGMSSDVNYDGSPSGVPKQGTSISFTQNNYSPKALSRIEIYRQTKNQFSIFERMAKA